MAYLGEGRAKSGGNQAVACGVAEDNGFKWGTLHEFIILF